jgi:hypothetical protein
MKLNLNFDYDKLFLKQITILIPKYHNNMLSFLTPILGLYGINVKDFINEFESKSKFINFDVIIPVTVRITKIKTFSIDLRTPYVSSVLNSLDLPFKALNVLTFYKIVTLKSLKGNILLNNNLKLNYSNLRIYLSRVFNLNESLLIKRDKLVYPNSYTYLRLSIKNTLHSFFFINNISFNGNYGLFVSFYNYDSKIVNTIKLISSLFNVKLLKIKPKLLSVFLPKIKGQTFFFHSRRFSNLNAFFNSVKFNQSSSYFDLFFKINNNILYPSFFNANFKRSITGVSDQLKLVFLLNFLLLRNSRVLKKLNLNLTKILFYKSS